MRLFHRQTFQFFAALLALFVFTGDLVADAISDATGLTVSQSSQQAGDDDSPCTACAVHCGAVTVFEPRLVLVPALRELLTLVICEEEGTPGVPAEIDLPPQLA